MRDQCAEFDFAPAGVLVPNADDEWFCRPSETFWLPSDDFGPFDFLDLNDGEPPRRVLAGGSKLKRLGTITSDRRELLRRKLASFWAGYIPEVERPPLFE